MFKGCHDHPQKTNKQKKRSKVFHDWQKAVYDSQRPLALGATPGKSSVAAKNKKKINKKKILNTHFHEGSDKGPIQTSQRTCTESNADEGEQ